MSREILRRLVLNYGQSWLGQLPYHLVQWCICEYYKIIFSCSCFARHSYVFGDIVPGVSDLDLTIMFDAEHKLTKQRLQKIYQQHKRLTKIIPFLGELNIFLKNELKYILPIVCSPEVRRDPVMLDFVGFSPPALTEISKVVFLLKVLESDKNNIFQQMTYREKKWRRMFELAEISAPETLNFENIMTATLQPIKHMVMIDSTIVEIKDYFLYGQKPKSVATRFLLANRYLDEVDVTISKEHPFKEIIYHQMLWEAWSLFVQARHSKSHETQNQMAWTHHIRICNQICKKMDWGLTDVFDLIYTTYSAQH